MWRGRSILLAWLAGAGSLGRAECVRAQPLFQIPEECGSEAEFRKELERLLGAAAPEALPSQLVIARSVADPSQYTLRLQLSGEIREIEDPDCRTLLRSAVVIAAAAGRAQSPPAAASPPPAALGPPPADFAESPPPAAPAPPSAELAESPPPAAPAPPSSRTEAPRPAPPFAVEGPAVHALSAGLGVSSGVLPGPSAALELGASVEPAPWGLAVSFRYWPEKSITSEGRGLSVSAFGGRVAGLLSLSAPVQLTLGVDVNRLSGSGAESVSRRGSDTAWQIAPSMGFAAIPWSVGHLRLELGLLGHVSLVRPRFLVIGYGDVYEVPEFGGSAIVRGAWLFR